MQPMFWQAWMHHDCSKDLVVSVAGCAALCLLFFIPNEVSRLIFLLKILSPGRTAHRSHAARSASAGRGVLLQFQVFQESSSALASGLISTPPFASGLAVVRTGAAPAPTQARQACCSLALARDFRASLMLWIQARAVLPHRASPFQGAVRISPSQTCGVPKGSAGDEEFLYSHESERKVFHSRASKHLFPLN